MDEAVVGLVSPVTRLVESTVGLSRPTVDAAVWLVGIVGPAVRLVISTVKLSRPMVEVVDGLDDLLVRSSLANVHVLYVPLSYSHIK